MAHSYVGDPETTQEFFRDGYFYSGDIGYLTVDGLLVITGREKTALNIGGDTVSQRWLKTLSALFQACGRRAYSQPTTILELRNFAR